jgi:hypothetical protein
VEVISTHLQADFDVVASMLAAAKPSPTARLLLPGFPELA